MKTIVLSTAIWAAAAIAPFLGTSTPKTAQPIDNQPVATGIMIPEITISAEPMLPEIVIKATKTGIPTGNIPEVTITAKMPSA